MKKFKLFLFSLCLCTAFFPNNVYAEDVSIDIKNFPDAAFLNYVKNNFDTNKDGILDNNEAQNVTVIPVGFTYSVTSDDYGKISITQSKSSFTEEISDFTGIEHFVKLETFSCQNQALSVDLDLSKNVELKALFCNNTETQELDLSKNPELLYLDCSNNQIEDLDLSSDRKLIYLDCSKNKITYIRLYSPDPRKKQTISKLSGDVMVSVDVMLDPPNPLAYYRCDHNELTDIDLLDLSKSLLWLKCNNNKIESTLLASDAANLIWLECDNNKIPEIEINNKKLRYIKCNNNKLTLLDIGRCTQLEKAICDNNKITDFYLPRKSNKLVYLSCSSNKLDVLNNIPASLEYIDFSKNQIDNSHFIKNGTSLKEINCSSNKLEAIDLSTITLLEFFYCDNNALADISFANNPLLKAFSGSSQKIYDQKVSKSDSKTYPYEFDLSDAISKRKADFSRVSDITVLKENNSSIKYKRDGSEILLLAEKPASIKYKYNLTGQLANKYLDVTLFFSAAPKSGNYGAGNDGNIGGSNESNDVSNIGGSGGGCNSGFVSGITALSLLIVLKKKK